MPLAGECSGVALTAAEFGAAIASGLSVACVLFRSGLPEKRSISTEVETGLRASRDGITTQIVIDRAVAR